MPEPSKKSLFKQIMKPKDWIMLATLIVVSIVCWVWVYKAYTQPFDYQQILGELLTNAEQS